MLFDPANADNIPDELKQIDGFVPWHYGQDGSKQPLRIVDGRLKVADAHDPASWLAFDDALAIVRKNPKVGLGFDLQSNYGIVGLDFDDCIIEETIADEVEELLRIVDTYHEISPSGEGVRMFGLGTLPEGCRKLSKLGSGIAIERYCHRRYLTLTGRGKKMSLESLDPLWELLDRDVFFRTPPAPRSQIGDDFAWDKACATHMLSLLELARADDYWGWFKVGSALAAYGDDMGDSWVKWSEQSPKFHAALCRKKWLAISSGTAVTIQAAFGTLLAMAREDTGRDDRSILEEAARIIGRPRVTHAPITIVPSPRVKPEDNRPVGEMSLPERDRLAYRPFPVEALPDPLRPFVEHAARALCCDEGPLAMVSLVTLAAAIGTSHRLCVKRTWKPYPLLWGVLLAASGDLKSPIIDLCLQPVRDRQSRLKERHLLEAASFDEALAEWKAAKAEAKQGDKVPPQPDKPAPLARLLTSDATVEALGQLLESNPRGLFVAVDELASLIGGMDRFKRGTSDEGFYLSSYSGLPHTIDRRTGEPKSIHIPRCGLSIIGGLQPAKAQAVLDPSRRASGLVQRMLFCLPPRRAYRWSDVEVPAGLLDAWAMLVESLYELGDPQGDPTLVMMSDGARAEFIAWTREHSRHSRSFGPDLAAAASKCREIPARLAIILHLVGVTEKRHAGGALVSAATMEQAIDIARWFRHEAERTFRLLEADALQLHELLSADAAGAGIIETLWDADQPMSREQIAEALAPTPAPHVVSALADLLHRGEIVRQGEGADERWTAADKAELPPLPTFPEFEPFALNEEPAPQQPEPEHGDAFEYEPIEGDESDAEDDGYPEDIPL